MKAPKFWETDNIISKLLKPFAGIYANQTAKRLKQTGYISKVPVICVGNLVAGGAGKTPVCIWLAKQLFAQGKKVHFIASGFGGNFDKAGNKAQKVDSLDCVKFGDEAVLLSKTAPTWVSKDRGEAAKMAENDGAEIIIMDDGFQNATLEKTFSIIVADGEYGFGNGKVIPAGPLRETVEVGLKRADCLLVIGKREFPLPAAKLPNFAAKLNIYYDPFLQNEDVVAFCAIARPKKFYDSLVASGLRVIDEVSFADHHLYNEQDLKNILQLASDKQAVVVTTEKDYVKIPKQLHLMFNLVKAEIELKDAEKLMDLIGKKIAKTA